jgi:hypothetical protein
MFCAVLVTCQLDKKSEANSRENILVWKNNHNGHLNDLRLSVSIHRKNFLQRTNLLPTPPPICSNTHTHSLFLSLFFSLSLSVSLLSCSLLTTLCWIFNRVLSNKTDHWINTFRKELFSFLKVTPAQMVIRHLYEVHETFVKGS